MALNWEEFKIEPDKDEGMSATALSQYLDDDTLRKKNLAQNEIEEMGEVFLKEIDRKKKVQNQHTTKLIPYILKHNKGRYDKEELLSYSHKDVLDIYNETKVMKRPAIVKFFHFLFNLS